MTSRERFEARSLELGRLIEFSFAQHDNGVYKMRDTHIAWLIWQAAERSTMERAITLFDQPHQEYFGADIQLELKELLNEQH